MHILAIIVIVAWVVAMIALNFPNHAFGPLIGVCGVIVTALAGVALALVVLIP